MAARSAALSSTQRLEAEMSSTGHSASSRAGCTSPGSVHPSACLSITISSGLGPQMKQRAVSGGIINTRSMAVPSLTTSCRRREKNCALAERCRVAAVYVVRALMMNEGSVSSNARVKITQ